MRIDRLIGILSVLLQKEKVTAPELAEKFEVSRRTINRDIEDLCKAGIPVCTQQGVHGGICIMDGYRMDRTLLTTKDMQMILAGLRSLDSVSGSHYYGQLMEKIKAGSSEFICGAPLDTTMTKKDGQERGNPSILIDLSSWHKESLSQRIGRIQNAIEEGKIIRFHYYAPKGDSIREIEPYYLIFKWSSWYVWGWCRHREDYRMFKLMRMDRVEVTNEQARERKVPLPDLSNERLFPGGIHVKAVFQPEMKWHLMEEFGADSFQVQPDGTLYFEHEYTDRDQLIRWMLTCKDQVTVLEPEDIREEIFHIADNIRKKYEV